MCRLIRTVGPNRVTCNAINLAKLIKERGIFYNLIDYANLCLLTRQSNHFMICFQFGPSMEMRFATLISRYLSMLITREVILNTEFDSRTASYAARAYSAVKAWKRLP